MRTNVKTPPAVDSPRWTMVRFVLGMLQMAGATATIVLLVATGVSSWTLAGTAITCALTTTSVLLFGRRRRSAGDR